jgi:hypothetical protein
MVATLESSGRHGPVERKAMIDASFQAIKQSRHGSSLPGSGVTSPNFDRVDMCQSQHSDIASPNYISQ